MTTYFEKYTVNDSVVKFILNRLYLNESVQNVQHVSSVYLKENLEYFIDINKIILKLNEQKMDLQHLTKF